VGVLSALVNSIPGVQTVKAILVVAAVGGAFAGGWYEKDIRDRAAAEKAAVKYAADLAKAQHDYEDRLAALDHESRSVAEAHQEAVASLNDRITKLQQEARHVRLDPSAPARSCASESPGGTASDSGGSTDYPVTREFVRLFNGAVDAANGAPSVPAGPTDPAGAPEEAGRAAAVTREDILDAHAEAMKICGEWRDQLNRIIEWNKEVNHDTQ